MTYILGESLLAKWELKFCKLELRIDLRAETYMQFQYDKQSPNCRQLFQMQWGSPLEIIGVHDYNVPITEYADGYRFPLLPPFNKALFVNY